MYCEALTHTHPNGNTRAHATYPLIEIATVNVDAACGCMYTCDQEWESSHRCMCVLSHRCLVVLNVVSVVCGMWLLLPFISRAYTTLYSYYILTIHQQGCYCCGSHSLFRRTHAQTQKMCTLPAILHDDRAYFAIIHLVAT